MELNDLKKKRSYSIDVLKYICFCLVVFIHCPFPHFYGDIMTSIARMAVPIFFMISGFFYKPNIDQDKKKCKKYFGLFLSMNIFWYLLYCIIRLCDGYEFTKWAYMDLNIKNFIYCFIFGRPFANEYVWFLHALGCVYLICIFIYWMKFDICKVLRWMWIPLFLFMFCISYGTSLFLGHSIQACFYRNGIFEGLGFFSLGYFMKIKKHKNIFNSLWFLLCLGFIGLGLTVCESFAFGRYDIYIGSVLLATASLKLAIKIECDSSFFSLLGRKSSMQLYLWHPLMYLVIIMLESLLIKSQLINWLPWINPILVVIVTSVFFYFVRKENFSFLHK